MIGMPFLIWSSHCLCEVWEPFPPLTDMETDGLNHTEKGDGLNLDQFGCRGEVCHYFSVEPLVTSSALSHNEIEGQRKRPSCPILLSSRCHNPNNSLFFSHCPITLCRERELTKQSNQFLVLVSSSQRSPSFPDNLMKGLWRQTTHYESQWLRYMD